MRSLPRSLLHTTTTIMIITSTIMLVPLATVLIAI
jgi:hypothetical protein